MSRPALLLISALYLFPAVAAPLGAQDAPSTQPRDSTQPVTSISAATEPSSGKKVWTNDDLSGLHTGAGVSSFGSNPAPARSTQAASPASKKNAAWYRDQILKLQAKIPPIDAQIANLRSAIEGKPTGDGKKSVRPYGVRADDWSGELDQLSKKRADITGKITEMQEDARRSGIPANALP